MDTLIGANLSELNAQEKKKLGIDGGIKIVGPVSGILVDSKFDEGFIITKINGLDACSIEQLEKELSKEKGAIIEGIHPDGSYDRYFTKQFQV